MAVLIAPSVVPSIRALFMLSKGLCLVTPSSSSSNMQSGSGTLT